MGTKFHTHPFNGPFSGTTQVSWYQKGGTNLDFTEARDSEWQWHQLGQMQVCTLLQTDNHTSIPSHIYTMLQNYIQLYVTLTKLCHISTIDHLVSFYISLVKCRKKLQYHCNSKPISSILKIAAVRYIRLSKTLTLRQVLETNMHRCAKFHQKWSNSCRDMVIQRFSKWRPSAILDF